MTDSIEELPLPRVELQDTSRTVEVVKAPVNVAWDAIGAADDAGYWLGNASEHDREAIRRLAREVGPESALRIAFPSMMTFILYHSRMGRFMCYVPGGDDALRAQGIQPDPKPAIPAGHLPEDAEKESNA